MKHFCTISLCFLALSLSAQETITYPYNPDGDIDGSITLPDLLDLLGVYSNAFTPTEIQIDGVGLAEIIGQLQADNATLTQQITDLQNADNDIDSTNEIQTLNLNGDTLRISGGNYILLSSLSYNLPINISMDSILYDNTGVVTFNAEVLPSAGSTITDKGFCWSTSNPIPTIYDEFESVSTGVGSFSFNYLPDEDSIIYYVRAYATSSEGMSYSNVYTFTTELVELTIGYFYAGGVIIWVDPNDSSSGLVCDISDLGEVEWGCYPTLINGADGTAIGTGLQNTLDILNDCGTPNIAADLCANSTAQGFTDWFLPSRDELNLFYVNQSIIDSLSIINGGSAFNGNYYSSSETNCCNAWAQAIHDENLPWNNGFQFAQAKYYTNNNGNNYVRAVRAF